MTETKTDTKPSPMEVLDVLDEATAGDVSQARSGVALFLDREADIAEDDYRRTEAEVLRRASKVLDDADMRERLG